MGWLRSTALVSCLLLLDQDQGLVEAVRVLPDSASVDQNPAAQTVGHDRGVSNGGYRLGLTPHHPSKALVAADGPDLVVSEAEDMFKLRLAVQREWGKLEPSQLTKVDPGDSFSEEIPILERGAPFDLYQVQTIQGPRLIKHFRMSSWEDLKAAQHEVWSMAKMKGKNVFLSFYGTAPGDGDGPEGPGMLVMTEPFAGNLQQVLLQHQGKLSLKKLLSFFTDIVDGMRSLRRHRVAHDPPTLDTLLVVGDVDDLDHAGVVLCSSLTNTMMRVCNLRNRIWRSMDTHKRAPMKELEKADVKALGTILMQMLREVETVQDDVFRDAIAKLQDLAAQMVLGSYSERPLDLSRLAALAKGIQRTVDPKPGSPFENALRRAAPILPVLAVMLFKPDFGVDASVNSLISEIQHSLKNAVKEEIEEDLEELAEEDGEEDLEGTETVRSFSRRPYPGNERFITPASFVHAGNGAPELN